MPINKTDFEIALTEIQSLEMTENGRRKLLEASMAIDDTKIEKAISDQILQYRKRSCSMEELSNRITRACTNLIPDLTVGDKEVAVKFIKGHIENKIEEYFGAERAENTASDKAFLSMVLMPLKLGLVPALLAVKIVKAAVGYDPSRAILKPRNLASFVSDYLMGDLRVAKTMSKNKDAAYASLRQVVGERTARVSLAHKNQTGIRSSRR